MGDALEQSMEDLDERRQESEVKEEYERKLSEANSMLQVHTNICPLAINMLLHLEFLPVVSHCQQEEYAYAEK